MLYVSAHESMSYPFPAAAGGPVKLGRAVSCQCADTISTTLLKAHASERGVEQIMQRITAHFHRQLDSAGRDYGGLKAADFVGVCAGRGFS